MNVLPSPVDVNGVNWSAERLAAAATVAGSNQRRVAQAATARLRFGNDSPDFAAWCDKQAPSGAAVGSAPKETGA